MGIEPFKIDWKLTLKVEDILRGQGMDPEKAQGSRPLFHEVAERTLVEGLHLLQPVALTREVKVVGQRHECILLDGGSSLTGPLVARHINGAQSVIASICSIGAVLEQTASKLFDTDPLFALALDGLGTAAVEKLAQQVCAGIGDKIQVEGLQASTPLSPGNPEWPIEVGQPQIFALLDPAQAGVSLTSGGMMIPKKSMSFIIGLGKEMSQANLCKICSLKERCRYQHV